MSLDTVERGTNAIGQFKVADSGHIKLFSLFVSAGVKTAVTDCICMKKVPKGKNFIIADCKKCHISTFTRLEKRGSV